MDDLTTFYNSLPGTKSRNKYECASEVLGLGYRIMGGKEAYLSPLPPVIKQFIMESKEVIVLPNYFNGRVIGFLLRSVYEKNFRYYSGYKIPYGAGVTNKPYYKPWVIVESCLDSDYLRQFYPYVIATLGATISNFLQHFLFATSPFIISGMDKDEAGENAYKRLCYKYKGRVKKIEPPNGNKDFGDTLEYLTIHNSFNFEMENMLIQASLQTITGGF